MTNAMQPGAGSAAGARRERYATPAAFAIALALSHCANGPATGSPPDAVADTASFDASRDVATVDDTGFDGGDTASDAVENDERLATDVPHVADPDPGLSVGCGTSAGTGLQAQTVVVEGVERTFLRFIPASYRPGTPMALVLAFHGSGGTSEIARSSFDLESHAGGAAIFVYPQARTNSEGPNRWDANLPLSNDYHFVDEMIRRTGTYYCIDRNRVFATGFSLGARFTSNLGCWRGDVLRAIAPVAPGGDAETLPLTGCVGEVGIWEGLGTEDPDHAPGAMRVRDYYAAANGCDATRTATTPAGCSRYDGCRREVPSVWCTYALGHMWPPIAPAGVWNFFSQFR